MCKLILILFLLVINYSFGQTIHLDFSGKAKSGKESHLKNVMVQFIQNKDILCVLKTDENSLYTCSLELESHDNISVYATKYGYQGSMTTVKLDELFSLTIQVNLDLYMYSVCSFHNDPSMYFGKNETKDMRYIDLRLFESMGEYPEICIRYTQTIHPHESKRIARKRMNNFRKYLIENKIDIRNILFEETYFILDDKQLEKDPRSRIHGIGFPCN